MGRNTQGVKVINLKTKDEIAAIAKVEMDSEVVEEEDGEVAENDSNNPEFKVKPQTGNNQINIGDEEELKKIEDEEAADDTYNSDEIEDKE